MKTGLEELLVGFFGGVILPTVLIYLIESIGIISFGENYWLPAQLIIGGGLTLLVLSEISKRAYSIIKKIKK